MIEVALPKQYGKDPSKRKRESEEGRGNDSPSEQSFDPEKYKDGVALDEYVKDNRFDPRREIAKERQISNFFKVSLLSSSQIAKIRYG